MPRETARDHLCSRYAVVIAARARTTSRLTPRHSYKSFSTFSWPICRYRTSTCASPAPPSAGACASTLKNGGRAVQKLLLPVVDLVRINPELTRQLGDRAVPLTAANATFALNAVLCFFRVRF